MRAGTRIGQGLVHASALLVVGLTLFAAAGPLATDDLWWHLALGRLYAEAGPLLDVDPRLHTALAAPHPNAWLGDLAWARLVEATGLDALRALHAALLAGIAALVWDALRRASRSPAIASLGCAIFFSASAYRLLQLRPELWTIALALVVHRLVAAPRRPSTGRLAAAVALCALWVNLHPGFPLGPGLLLATALGHGLARLARDPDADDPGRSGTTNGRLAPLVLATLAGFLATTLNPLGPAVWATDVSAGASSVGAGLVLDEWRPLDPFAWPSRHVPPTPAAWLASWALALAVGLRLLLDPDARRPRDGRDWTEAGLALAGLLAPLVAVRFVWLGIWPMLFVARGLAPQRAFRGRPTQEPGETRGTSETRRAAMLAVAAGVTLALLVQASGWRILAPRPDLDRWRASYDADRYFAHAVWWLDDVAAEGRAFHVYSMGGFLGYWLGPRLQTFVDGSLNVPDEALRDYGAIVADAPEQGDAADVTALLDRYAVDWVVGVGLPRPPPAGRPWRYTTTLLEGDPRWIPVYRGLRGAVYLRAAPRNAARLERVARYYAAERVPFDPTRGLLVERALDEATGWAIEHGVAPVDWTGLERAARTGPPGRRGVAANRLAWTLAVLGRYEAALAVDEALDFGARPALAAERLRRRVWCWLRLGRGDAAARELASIPEGAAPALGALAGQLGQHVNALRGAAGEDGRALARRAFLPLSAREAGRIKAVEGPPALRTRPRDRASVGLEREP